MAVEVKNRAVIDPSKDLKTFESKTREGWAGPFDTSVFVSVRAPTGAARAMELFEDADGRGTVPVSFVGPRRRAAAIEEALQGHLLCVAFVAKCQRGLLALQTAPHDDEVRSLVDGVARPGGHLGGHERAEQGHRLAAAGGPVRARAPAQLLTWLCDARDGGLARRRW